MKKRKMKTLLKKNFMLLIILAIAILFGILSPSFLTPMNLKNICSQNAYFVVAAIGVGLVMISGGIDFSAGQCLSVVGVCVATFLQWSGCPIWAAVVMGIFTGILLGSVNGMVISVLGVHPMIATIATMTTFKGISYLISGSKTFHYLPKTFMVIGQGEVAGIPIPVIVAVIVAVATHLMLELTCFGRFLYAVGGNSEAARLAGIKPQKVRWTVYIVAGALYAVAAILLTARGGTANSSTGTGLEFDAITACVLGGVSFQGGQGRIGRIIEGCLLLGILSNGMQLLGIGIYVRYVVIGIVMIATVGYDTYSKGKNKNEVILRKFYH